MEEYHNHNQKPETSITDREVNSSTDPGVNSTTNRGENSTKAHGANSTTNRGYNRGYKRATDRGMLTGMFRDRESTENAYNALHERGYSKEDINLIMSEETRKKHFSDNVKETEIGSKAAEGAGKGSAIGGTVGAIAGVVLALGTSLVIPGLGIIIAGPIAAGLAGAGAGGLTGGIIGALIGSGIPEARAKLYESGIKDGQIVLGVNPRNDEDAKYFENNWRTNNAQEIHR